eukprot:TRINITY_DN2803_c0_g1_i1.p2 TRINITY_DN2803_c0_g1~~TRINITY_DN2803_c0_g1_i1.p2  ORF type:complete len:102 (-),score=9.79 TRINITY_DN2803_c0_g1_i1:61-366(-)
MHISNCSSSRMRAALLLVHVARIPIFHSMVTGFGRSGVWFCWRTMSLVFDYRSLNVWVVCLCEHRWNGSSSSSSEPPMMAVGGTCMPSFSALHYSKSPTVW